MNDIPSWLKPRNFKEGDKVICVYSDGNNYELKRGKEYTIKKVNTIRSSTSIFGILKTVNLVEFPYKWDQTGYFDYWFELSMYKKISRILN